MSRICNRKIKTIKKLNKTYNLNSPIEFKILYKKFWKKLYIICYNQTNHKEVSEEIVQDIFISLWKRRKELVITSSIEHYLVKSAKLKVIDHYRKLYTKKHKNISQCDLCEHPEFDEKCLEHNEALFEFLEQEIQLIVNKLPCQCQKVYRLSREQQLNTSEIAKVLNISTKTVKNHLTRALKFIRVNMS
ncbi:RNA polymerase sigma-70 factor [Flavivirga jejuensis]|uniref:RNA polymerase sigma-70 factor n=1 Tax=Flavivirga jejuensis TaxID=870487 RepID=A0ABT8WSG7_9FLAO|nr:RNA polymerase sigma-70 factor [Flavivirga jejuensis]MDO5976113.1 RNA polymerase sigma-70 factor [Flavivirga jejuensis]